jgi:hypothetical protein
MELEDFIERVVREQPDELSAAEVAEVSPRPWVTRHGSGQKARIRMKVGERKYERRQGENVWNCVEEWTMGAAL